MLAVFKLKPTSNASGVSRDTAGVVGAIDRVMAVIEFSPAGMILTANANFSAAMGYELSEIRGHHHRMFAEPA